jgi:hypothetical protein
MKPSSAIYHETGVSRIPIRRRPHTVTRAVYGAPRTRHDTTTATIDITARATRRDDVTPGMHTPRP